MVCMDYSFRKTMPAAVAGSASGRDLLRSSGARFLAVHTSSAFDTCYIFVVAMMTAEGTRMADDFEEVLLSLLEGVASRFSHAKVEVVSEKGPRRLKLSSSVPETSSITMIPDPGQIDLFMGEATRIELPESKKSVEEVLEEIRAYVEGVAEGRFEEMVWEAGGRTLRSRGVMRGLGGDRDVVGQGGWALGFLWPDESAISSTSHINRSDECKARGCGCNRIARCYQREYLGLGARGWNACPAGCGLEREFGPGG